ncbi:MAG TPA: hydantoinase/oxoprolinase family protein, partial [bacterium]|nr:hydantoinase/oxoprolinase family protein [bacterium]
MQIAIDTGGTFTDCLGRRADGTLLHLKLPSTPHDPTAALLDGVARLVAMAGGEAPTRIVHGSTVATNALLEGTGGEAVLILDRGYEDLLLLARQQRPDLYALEPRPIPRPLPRSHVLGFPGRTLADGSALSEATDADFAELLAQLAAFSDLEAIGICFLHGHAHPGRERALREALHGAGLAVPITCSHELPTSPGEYARAVTTALNARLIPVVGRYLNCLGTELAARYPGARLEIVLSNGDALPPHEAAKVPVRMLLSGPAGGVQFGMQLAEILGRPVLTLDIGGTSTDCACIPGEPLERLGGTVAGLPVQAPMLDLETVGAGGGSILWVDAGDALQVGPRSTGADPGPACYGLGGTLPTLTDAHVVLGHLSLDRLLGGTVAVNPALATAALAPLAEQLGIPIQEVARGAIAITDQRIAEAVRQVSAARGHDPSQFVLVALGGAGGLHAAGVAQLLGIDTVCFPPLAGLASARGLAACGVVRRVKRALGGRWPLGPEFVESYLGLVVEAREGWRGLEDPRDPSMATTAWARYVGQDASLGLGIESPEPLDLRFHALHRRVYGFAQDDAPVELTALEVALSVPQDPWPLTDDGTRRQSIDGPFIVAEDNATLLIPDGATAALHPSGCLLVSLVPEPLTYPGSVPGGVVDSAVALTLANDLLSSVAEEMALALEHSAHSSNIKDRRDLSTAV